MMKLSDAADMTGARLHGEDALFTGVSKDTRDIAAGDLYVAIRGERFDGHDFVEQARRAGAVGALVQLQQHSEIAQLEVDDTIEALGRLAAAWRQRFDGRMIGLTGSNGKTTVKEMCRHVLLSVAGEQAVLATEGNLNNNIGVPMTLLRLRAQHRYAVIEMGANHVGEIDYLTRIARPDVALLNNAGPAHLEGFGSLDNIAHAKAEIYHGLDDQGVAIINLDDRYAPLWLELCAERQRMTFSVGNADADVCLIDGQVRYRDGSARLALTVPGAHNLANAMAATAALLAIGIGLDDIVEALNGFSNIKGRLNLRQLPGGARVIDDTYNANPASVKAGIDVLCAQPGRHVLVLGDMGELGADEQALHRDIGEYAKQAGVDRLFACGDLSRAAVDAFGDAAEHAASAADIAAKLATELDSDSIVLVKGSRFMKMEQIIDALLVSQQEQQRREVN